MPYIKEEDQWWYINSKQRTKCVKGICSRCNKEFIRIRLNKYKLNFCSKKCSNTITSLKHKESRKGSGNPMWKGGKKLVSGGYVKIYNPSHPNCDSKNCVLEHRLIMESYLKRYLLPTETVHHKNGKRDDNRIENLELFISNHPAGQKPKDLVNWAKTILKLYNNKKILNL